MTLFLISLAALCQVPCQNGGHCAFPGRCSCPPGWTGLSCQTGTAAPHCTPLHPAALLTHRWGQGAALWLVTKPGAPQSPEGNLCVSSPHTHLRILLQAACLLVQPGKQGSSELPVSALVVPEVEHSPGTHICSLLLLHAGSARAKAVLCCDCSQQKALCRAAVTLMGSARDSICSDPSPSLCKLAL